MKIARRTYPHIQEDTMKKRSIHISAFLLVLLLLLGQAQASGVQAGSDILYVAPGAACLGTPNCYATIQEALAVAVAGVEIRVAGGTYTDLHDCPRNDVVTTGTTPAVVCLDKTVTLSGGWDNTFTTHDMHTYPTALSASGLGRVLYITGAVSPTVENLVITLGNPNGLGGYQYFGQFDVGGGVYVMTANATLRDNWIHDNSAPGNGGGGAGVYLGQSNSLLLNNRIENNVVTSDGGGGGVFIFQGAPSLTGNSLSVNSANTVGGAVYIFDSSATFTSNLFNLNSANLYGGGLDVASCSPTLTGNIFSLNAGLWGGGITLWYSNSLLTNNVFIDNSTTGMGSGLFIRGGAPTLLHTTLARNLGGDGSAVFISDEAGDFSTLTMINSIMSGQATGISAGAGSQVLLDGVLWYGNTANTGGTGSFTISNAFTGDPAFSPLDGYHLASASAAINRGVHAGVLTDIDNQPRDFLPDLGADEYLGPGAPSFLFLPLALK
jgi:Right handed beta helix region